MELHIFTCQYHYNHYRQKCEEFGAVYTLERDVDA